MKNNQQKTERLSSLKREKVKRVGFFEKIGLKIAGYTDVKFAVVENRLSSSEPERTVTRFLSPLTLNGRLIRHRKICLAVTDLYTSPNLMLLILRSVNVLRTGHRITSLSCILVTDYRQELN